MNWRLAILMLFLGAQFHAGLAAERGGSGVPKRGGILHLSEPSDLRSLDPAIAYDNASVPLCKMLFRGLLDYDESVNLVPDQASDWNISVDGKTYTFHLRPGVRFANGRLVEANDYIYSFERILNPKVASPGQTFFLCLKGADDYVAGKAAHVAGLRAPDAHTLVIELAAPQFTFRYVLAMNFANVVPREVVEKYGDDFQSHLVGSGPYKLTEWRRGVRWHFERNAYYAGTDGYVDALELMVGADEATTSMMIERGEIHSTLASPADAIRFKRDARLADWLRLVSTANVDYIFMNTEMKPFDDVRVRRAVNHAINKERLVKLTGGFNSVANGIVPVSLGWTNETYTRYDYNPEKARALLREAGFPNGFKTELWYMVDLPVIARLAQGAQQDLHEIGIEAELKPVNGSTFLIKASSRKQIAFGVWGWFADYPDPSNFLDVLFNGSRIAETDCNNVAFLNNPAINQLLDAAAINMNADERTKILREAEKLLMADAPWVPLVNERVPVLVNSRLKGQLVHPVWMWRYEKVWLEP